jgi:hypothetical protein
MNDCEGCLSRNQRMRRLAKILWSAPFVICPIIFVIVSYTVADLNNGSIGDGFRKLNTFLSVLIPLSCACWSVALLITGVLDLPLIPTSRLRFWGLAFAFVVVVTIACVLLEP